jgi:hypothetical protein
MPSLAPCRPGNGGHDEHQEQSQSEEVLGLPMFPDLDSLDFALPGPEQPQIPGCGYDMFLFICNCH